MLSKSPSELESEIVRSDAVDTKSILLKSINGIVGVLKRSAIVPQKSIIIPSGAKEGTFSGGDSGEYKDSIAVDTNAFVSIEERIEDLNYLISPVTNGEVRNEINKIIEIFKFNPQLASVQDLYECVNLAGFDNLDGGNANSIYGGHKNIDGNSQTLILRKDSAYNWQYNNPILMDQEIGLEMDTFKFKIGDGIHKFLDLPYRDIAIVVQELGESLIMTMSQKAVTRELETISTIYEILKSHDD